MEVGLSSVQACEGWSVKCRGVWRSKCQLYRGVEVGVSSVGECGSWSFKCIGVLRSEFQV